MKITKDMSISEVLKKYPASRDVFAGNGMGCIGCMGASAESLEKGAVNHGMDISEMLRELNKAARNS